MLCDLVANAQSYTVSSLICYIMLVNKKKNSEEWNEGENK